MTAIQVPVTPEDSSAAAPPRQQPPPPDPVIGRAPPALGLNLRTLLDEMVAMNASDLHICAGEHPKLRIDGDMTNASTGGVLTTKDTMQLAYSVLTENQKKRFETEDELDFSFGIQNLARFRGNCFKQRGRVSLVGAGPVGQMSTRWAKVDPSALVTRSSLAPGGSASTT